jgi:hypothetical protein
MLGRVSPARLRQRDRYRQAPTKRPKEPAMHIGEEQEEFEILPAEEEQQPTVLPEREPQQQPEGAPA